MNHIFKYKCKKCGKIIESDMPPRHIQICDLYFIRNHLFENIKHKKRITYPKTAIWRYSEEYESEYPTNSELPIEVVTGLYKKYITEFKFKKSEVKGC